jgi:uncharacterized protein YggE
MRLAGLTAALTLALAGGLAAPVAAQDPVISLAPGEVLLKVDAEGEFLVRPDMMGISAGVVTTGRTAKEALDANAALANRLVAAVRASGVEPRDVQTSELTVNPQFARDEAARVDNEDSIRRITGYVARNRLALRLRDLRSAANIVNALFEAGANEVQGPSFGLQDPAPALKGARQAGIAQARVQAETYAEALGMRIARVLRVSERDNSIEEDGTITVTGSRIRSTPIEPGEITVRTQVWVDYAMVPR